MPIIIPINKKRIPFVLLISLSISVILFIVIVYESKNRSNGFGFYYIYFFLALVVLFLYSLILATIAFVDYCKTLFDKNAFLSITEVGIIDNLSIFSCGKILWEDISDVQIIKAYNVDFLIIKLWNADKFLNKTKKLTRFILRGYVKKYGAPIIISQKRVNMKLAELKKIIWTNKPI